MSLFRNVCRSSKCLINCRRTFITAHPLTGGGGGRVCQTPRLLAHNVPSKIFIKHWRSRGTGRDDDKKKNDDDEDHFDVSRDCEDEKDSENELFQGKIQGRQRVVDKKIPVGPAVIQELQKMFGMTHEEALTTIYSAKFVLVADAAVADAAVADAAVADEAVLKSICCLKDFEIPKEQIQRSPWILLVPADQLEEKIGLLADDYLFHNYFDGLGFCYFPTYKIKLYKEFFKLEQEDFPDHFNRIYCMADRLMVPVDHLTERIVKYPGLLTVDFHRIEIFMNILNKYEIHREDILKNMKSFFFSSDLAERRLKEVISVGCKTPKIWMCYCTEVVFDRIISKYKTQKDALDDCRSLEEYLMKRLECSYEELVSQLDYDERLRKTNVVKIQKRIDFLFSEGFQPHQIRQWLRVLKQSEKRSAMRIKRLKELGVTNIPLTMLTNRSTTFENYCAIFKNHSHLNS